MLSLPCIARTMLLWPTLPTGSPAGAGQQPVRIAVDRLDLDDPRAELGEQRGGERRRVVVGRLDDGDAVERSLELAAARRREGHRRDLRACDLVGVLTGRRRRPPHRRPARSASSRADRPRARARPAGRRPRRASSRRRAAGGGAPPGSSARRRRTRCRWRSRAPSTRRRSSPSCAPAGARTSSSLVSVSAKLWGAPLKRSSSQIQSKPRTVIHAGKKCGSESECMIQRPSLHSAINPIGVTSRGSRWCASGFTASGTDFALAPSSGSCSPSRSNQRTCGFWRHVMAWSMFVSTR